MKQPYLLVRPVLLVPLAELKIETPHHLAQDQIHLCPCETVPSRHSLSASVFKLPSDVCLYQVIRE